MNVPRERDFAPIAASLIQWHRSHGRHDLPWQHPRTPYRVWVSEIMLQQTQVATVIGYFERFLQRFPDVATLAAAPLDEVLHLWTGLGYYSRARNLHRTAQHLVAEQGGELPCDAQRLAALPGIGRSTAAAIVAQAWGQRAAILDGNVRRVLARYFALDASPSTRAAEQQLWQHAERCTPDSEVATYTQAIMDFGATLCTRAKPLCMHCPLRAHCQAHLQGRVHELPAVRKRAARGARSIVMLLAVRADGHVLLQQRAPRGIWGGLWTPPQFEHPEQARQFCGRELQGTCLASTALPEVHHAFTHFDLTITPYRAQVPPTAAVMDQPGWLWYNAREPARVGLPAPIVSLLSGLARQPSN